MGHLVTDNVTNRQRLTGAELRAVCLEGISNGISKTRLLDNLTSDGIAICGVRLTNMWKACGGPIGGSK